ncbi:Serine/threonine-protein phosphatase [Psidium guajava]|nr:Serine/threonine-protein phosphatase [Psidium guajava]
MHGKNFVPKGCEEDVGDNVWGKWFEAASTCPRPRKPACSSSSFSHRRDKNVDYRI